ncbi:MAG: tetratricopeptide repeat protein [Chitinophagaceae bacterium]
MKYFLNTTLCMAAVFALETFTACNTDSSIPSKESISQINLKRGNVISCGATDKQFGSVEFAMTCNDSIKGDFNLAIELLHSFEYDDSEKVFAKIIDEAPDCAMAYWGVAMCNFHPLWTAPLEAELKKGSKAITIAGSISNKSARESAYINSLAIFYNNWEKIDHQTRCLSYEKAMEKLYKDYPGDKEAAVLYALALDASAKPTDKTYANQKKAASILNTLYTSTPNHPGVIHYLIHTYDYPGMAEMALPFANKYAAVAPSSAHALHMPSHIFTRLGIWDKCIKSNLESVASAKCYAEQAGIKGHWDEELHGMDYLVYAYLQKGENKLAKEQLIYLQNMKEVIPMNFKVAYAFASIPARFALENKNWKEAAALKLQPAIVPWTKFPWQESIIHFSRLLGSVHVGNLDDANTALAKMKQLHDTLRAQKDTYKAGQVAIQVKTGHAWILFAGGKTREALQEMQLAAAMEDSTEKHPVTAGEVLPARELLADMFLQAGQYDNAMLAYEAVLQKSPNRFNSLYGAGLAAAKAGNRQKAISCYNKLASIIDMANSDRPELAEMKKFLALR